MQKHHSPGGTSCEKCTNISCATYSDITVNTWSLTSCCVIVPLPSAQPVCVSKQGDSFIRISSELSGTHEKKSVTTRSIRYNPLGVPSQWLQPLTSRIEHDNTISSDTLHLKIQGVKNTKRMVTDATDKTFCQECENHWNND